MLPLPSFQRPPGVMLWPQRLIQGEYLYPCPATVVDPDLAPAGDDKALKGAPLQGPDAGPAVHRSLVGCTGAHIEELPVPTNAVAEPLLGSLDQGVQCLLLDHHLATSSLSSGTITGHGSPSQTIT